MKRVYSVSLAGQIYHIDYDAYDVVSSFIESREKALGKGAELDGLFSLLAGKFSAQLQEKACIVVDRSMAIEAIRLLDHSFIPPRVDNDKLHEKKHVSYRQPIKRYYRDLEHGRLCGVLSGLAIYKGWNVIALRVLAVSLFVGFAWLLGVGWIVPLSYLLVWMIVPSAVTATQRLELRGLPPTEENLSHSIAESAAISSPKEHPLSKFLGCLFKLAILSAMLFAAISFFLVLGKLFLDWVNWLFSTSDFWDESYAAEQIPLWMPIAALILGLLSTALPLFAMRKPHSSRRFWLLPIWITTWAATLTICVRMAILLFEILG